MTRLLRWTLIAALLALFASCSSGDAEVARACEPGRQIACSCADRKSGTQRCGVDGTRYEACSCSDASSGAGGVDASSGAGGTAGSAASTGAAGSSTAGTSGASGDDGSGGASGTGADAGAADGAAGAGGNAGAGAGGGAGSSGAAGSAGVPNDAGLSCPPASVSNVTQGSCDLIKQDCAPNLTCSLQQADGGAWQKACLTLGTGAKTLGESCQTHAECAPDLRCTLDKCTRPCCSEAEASICGANGQCFYYLSFAAAARFNFCTFFPHCAPWTRDCPATTNCYFYKGSEFICLAPSYAPDAGATEGKVCQSSSDCGDMQQCIYTSADASVAVCRFFCKVSSSGAPDGGTVGGAPGLGGCPAGQICRPYSAPSWLGYCSQ